MIALADRARYLELVRKADAYDRLKAAVENALDNSWHIDTPHPDCVCHDWRGCTVLDDKDAQELNAALTPPAAPGDKGE